MSIAFDPSRPIYRQIMEEIARRVIGGVYPPGGQLPSVRDLAGDLRVNPNTVARAYLELEREGFIAARRGQGSFVTGDPARIARERCRVADAAADRFAGEVAALNLSSNEIADLIATIRNRILHEKSPVEEAAEEGEQHE